MKFDARTTTTATELFQLLSTQDLTAAALFANFMELLTVGTPKQLQEVDQALSKITELPPLGGPTNDQQLSELPGA